MKCVIASHNQGKIAEIKALLADLPITLYTQADFGILDVDETATTFVGNALLKAHYVCEQTGLPTLADDSGLEIAALHGAPGIYSARYAGSDCDFKKNIAKVLAKMQGVEARQANFRTVCVFLKSPKDPSPIISEGVWQGEIVVESQGHDGFGYDPIFYVPELQCTVAELSFDKKNSLSHRFQALATLKARLKVELGL
jgi:XTP/dITP diphosphohydrolase